MILSRSQWFLFFISLSLSTFMMVLDYSIANISIPYIAGDLGVSDDQGTYVITSFAVGNAIGLALTGWLAKRVGQIRLIVLSLALFTFFSWMCGFSISLEMLVINRFIQGFVSGPIIPMSQSLIILFGEVKNRVRDLAIWSMIIITAPVLGPLLGGYISEWHVWPWIFYINVPVGIFCVITIWLIMREHETPTEKLPIDWIGFFLLAVGVSCLQILLDKGQQWDWLNSIAIRSLTIGTVVSFTYLIIREWWHETPFFDLKLFRIPSFAVSIVCLCFSYGIYFGTVVVVPLWLQEYMNYDAVWAGIAVSALGVAPVFLGALTPMVIRKCGNIGTLMIGFSFFAIGCFISCLLTTLVDVQHVALVRFLFGFGFVCYFIPILQINIQDISMDKLPMATGMFHFFRSMVGAVGTSVFTTLFIRRTYFHHERIGSFLTPFNPFTPRIDSEQTRALLNQALDQQAAMLAINEVFFLMGWLFVGLIVLLLIWKLASPAEIRN